MHERSKCRNLVLELLFSRASSAPGILRNMYFRNFNFSFVFFVLLSETHPLSIILSRLSFVEKIYFGTPETHIWSPNPNLNLRESR
jgi:hypothetical protein